MSKRNKKYKKKPRFTKAEIIALRTKYNVPNWKKSREYNYLKPNSPEPVAQDKLRWEFLRRDQDYRTEYDDGILQPKKYGLYEIINPNVRGDELGYRQILFIDSVHRGGRLWAAAEVSEDLGDVAPDVRDNIFIRRFGRYVLELEEDGYVMVVFDPKRPPTPQIARASDVLHFYRKEMKRNEPKEIIEHPNIPDDPAKLLRVLDAANEGATLLQIGKSIYGKRDSDEEARAIAHERLKKARTCWQRMS